jgi:hypothetical protein
VQASHGLLPAAIIATDQVSGLPGQAPLVQTDIERLKEDDGDIETPKGNLAVLDMDLVHLTLDGRTSVY